MMSDLGSRPHIMMTDLGSRPVKPRQVELCWSCTCNQHDKGNKTGLQPVSRLVEQVHYIALKLLVG